MIIIPAIDLYNGKVVRFVKGDPVHSTIYSDNPLSVARRWQDDGAKVIHIVDLSAALGEPDNAATVEHIIREIDIDVEVGGGIRNIEKALRFKNAGAKRIIVGTKSLDDGFLKELLSVLGQDKLAVSVDIKDGFVATKGWQETSKFKPIEFIEKLVALGIKWVIYTDISKDGTLEGLNFKALKELSAFKGINFIASGGVSGISDLKKVKEDLSFVWGIISGKALYDGKLSLPEAVAFLGE
ncbi:MAG: 1-(5-phosphoribosyl)-5-[(5-phosphoribosylamino)methylideneamino]imidazole-4-carboxamide isomerase [Candidatus Omnitrophota bacterium]|jgi:phosphoribosylformimino-5-aminoimidazole carboxamide ribotide isomerase